MDWAYERLFLPGSLILILPVYIQRWQICPFLCRYLRDRVDCSRFCEHLSSTGRLKDIDLGEDTGSSNDPQDFKCHLLMKQIEFVDVMLLNSTDLLEGFPIAIVQKTLKQLNPRANVVEFSYHRYFYELSHVLRNYPPALQFVQRRNTCRGPTAGHTTLLTWAVDVHNAREHLAHKLIQAAACLAGLPSRSG